jgi:hypothetical protein
VKYVSRYTHRVAIANSRLVSMHDSSVEFKWKDYRQPQLPKVMHLSIVEFVRRFLLHVLPPGFVRIRYYGFLSNRDRHGKVQRCQQLLGKKYKKMESARTTQAVFRRAFGHDVTCCRKCGRGHYLLIARMGGAETLAAQYNPHAGGYREATLRPPGGGLAFGRSTQVSTCARPSRPAPALRGNSRATGGAPSCPTPLRSVGTPAI